MSIRKPWEYNVDWSATVTEPIFAGETYTKMFKDAVEALKSYKPHDFAFCVCIPTPEKVIFNDPATIVYWADGSKTVVKCMKGDTFNKETGFAIACAKKMYGNGNGFKKLVKKYVPKDEEKEVSND